MEKTKIRLATKTVQFLGWIVSSPNFLKFKNVGLDSETFEIHESQILNLEDIDLIKGEYLRIVVSEKFSSGKFSATTFTRIIELPE